MLRIDFRWEPLRGNAKFQQLMKEAEARADAQPRPKKQADLLDAAREVDGYTWSLSRS